MTAGTPVTCHESEHGRLELARRQPDPRLRGNVVRLTGYAEFLSTSARYHEPPPTFVPVIVNVGTPYRVLDPADRRAPTEQPGSFVGGLGERSVIVESAGSALCVQVDLSPPAASRFLGVPMRELADRVIALADVLGPEVGRLEERLHAATDWETRLELVESALIARLVAAPPSRPDVLYAWRRLEETGGRIRIGDLAAELGCSRKHLTSQFHHHVGLPPKATAQLFRFNRSLKLLESGAAGADVAFECGYADQAHFANEFRRFSGSAPGVFMREPQVQFLQDASEQAA